MDTVSQKERSRIMSLVRSRGNKSTELRFISLLRKRGIKGWRRKYKVLGNPDFTFPKKKIVIFIDGCFWHGCPQHLRLPSTNKKYWKHKIERNILRDKAINKALKNKGWCTIRFWEHELRQSDKRGKQKLEVIADLSAASAQ